MSLHAYSRCWLHLIWATLNREKIFNQQAQLQLSGFLTEYTRTKAIYMKTHFVNPDHIHVLIDLPEKYSIEEVMKLLKGSSSHWINQNRIVRSKFFWGRGYGAFSVSQSNIDKVTEYITNQYDHHRRKSFTEEYEEFAKAYGLELKNEVNR